MAPTLMKRVVDELLLLLHVVLSAGIRLPPATAALPQPLPLVPPVRLRLMELLLALLDCWLCWHRVVVAAAAAAAAAAAVR